MSKAQQQSGARRGRADDDDKKDNNNNKDKKKEQKHIKPLEKFDVLTFRDEAGLKDDDIILGIDEAGRGPAIGDMVYGAALVSIGQHQRVIDCGVADSKMLDEKSREKSRKKMEKLEEMDDEVSSEDEDDDIFGGGGGADKKEKKKESKSTFKAIVLPITPEAISEAMFGRAGHATLNTLSHSAAIALIKRATELTKGKLAAVFVDTVGPPATYERLLRGRFPHLHIRVAKKADSIFPIVSAASIFAKTERDRGIAKNYPDGEVGSGYPSDERTTKFLNGGGMLNKFFGFTSSDIRFSWAPVAKIVNAKCIETVFEADDDRAREQGLAVSGGMKQMTLSFARAPPKRDTLFSTVLGMTSTTSMGM